MRWGCRERRMREREGKRDREGRRDTGKRGTGRHREGERGKTIATMPKFWIETRVLLFYSCVTSDKVVTLKKINSNTLGADETQINERHTERLRHIVRTQEHHASPLFVFHFLFFTNNRITSNRFSNRSLTDIVKVFTLYIHQVNVHVNRISPDRQT